MVLTSNTQQISPSQVWTFIGIVGLTLALYLMSRGMRRIWLLRNNRPSVPLQFIAWAFVIVDIVWLLLFGTSLGVGIITWDLDREWTIFAKIGVAYQGVLVLFEALFLAFTEMARRYPSAIADL